MHANFLTLELQLFVNIGYGVGSIKQHSPVL